MKKKQIISLIKECFEEVLKEDAAQIQNAQQKEKQTKEDYLKAKKDVVDAEMQDLQQSSSSTSLYEDELDEMARIPTIFNLADGVDPEQYTGAIKQIAQYLKDNPGSTKIQIAHGLGKGAQQAVNMILNKMVEDDIVIPGGLAAEPKYKQSPGLGTGLRGRKITPEGSRKRAIKSVYDKLMNGREDEITFEEQDLIGDEDMEKIRSLVAQGGIKRGRKPKSPDEKEMGDINEPEEPIFDKSNDISSPLSPFDDEFSLGGNVKAISDEDDELTKLEQIKDNLLNQLKHKKIDLATYKREIGDIPERIKQLRSQLGNEEEEDLFESNLIRNRLMKLANIKK